MNKRLLLSGAAILIALIVFTILIINKANLSVHIKGGKATSLSVLVARASDFLKKGELLQAKSLYQQLLNEFPNSGEIVNWQKKIEEINIKLLFSSIPTLQSALYEIKPADTLAKIAREFKTTAELIMKSNKLAGDKILLGRKIKVWKTPFTILVYKSKNTLILRTDEEILKTYIVSTGTNNSTPAGNFKIINKLPNPTWFKAGAVVAPGSPDNILGSRWLGFDLPGYGIHGTTDPGNLGKQVTQGCIRMSNPDVEELYTIIPIGTEVTIVD